MKQSLHIGLNQHLTLTPQLQQAIRLLQLSSMELQQEIQQALEKNPLLELAEDDKEDTTDATADSESETIEEAAASVDIEESAEFTYDATWQDSFIPPTSSAARHTEDEFAALENMRAEPVDLHSHLAWQANLATFSQTDQAIAAALIDAINENGFLSCSLEEILLSMGEDEKTRTDEIELDDIEAVLHQIQNFDPIGVGARNLQECLLLQLKQLPSDTPHLAAAKLIVSKHFDLLGSKNCKLLQRRTHLSDEALKQAMNLIQSLNPRPGNGLSAHESNYITPDLRLVKQGEQWVVKLNEESIPKLRINPNYASLSRTATGSDAQQYIRSHLQEAKWFMKSIKSRNQTLLRVATAIFDQQRDFLELGEAGMKPLILSDIAQKLELHESTVSRITTHKYIETPRGIFELKYFFSSHVNTQDGGECSATAIRAKIKALVANESPAKPLSDSQIAQILVNSGINVARRTVAKYRESLKIPSSNDRRTIFLE